MAEGRFTYKEIYNYINGNLYPDGFKKGDKLALRKRAKFFLVQEQNLYYIGGAGKASTPRLVIEDCDKRERIISSIHDANHLGVHRTNDLVSKKYYWPYLYKDIVAYVGTCNKCQRNNKMLKKDVGSLNPIPVPSKLWCQVGMDLVGPLPVTPRGNKYIVTLTDYFSKWAEAAPLPNKTADGVATFMHSVICRFGCPEVLITDQGREFVNELSTKLYQMTNTKHRITSAYHPQTNGLTERFNQTLSRCLAKLCNEEHTDWDQQIDTALMGYRASFQSTIKHSPYFMLFQKEMRLPIDNEIMPSVHDKSREDMEVTIKTLLGKRKEVFQNAAANIKDAQKKQKETYDRKHVPKELSVGTEVMLENTSQKERKGGKLDELFKGTYTIAESLGKGLYKLSNQQGRVLQKKFNISRLKVYQRRVVLGTTTPGPDLKKQLPKHSNLEESNMFRSGLSDEVYDEPPSDPPPQKRKCHESSLEDYLIDTHQHESFVEVLQGISSKDLISKISSLSITPDEIKSGRVSECLSYGDFTRSACGKRRKLQTSSNAISCITSSQIHYVADFLMSEFSRTDQSSQHISYTLDVMLPEVVLRLIIAMFGVTRNEARVIMFTSPRRIQDVLSSNSQDLHDHAEKKKEVRKRKRCGTCEGCIAPNCGKCIHCLAMPRFGGRGTLKKCCKFRQCKRMYAETNGILTSSENAAPAIEVESLKGSVSCVDKPVSTIKTCQVHQRDLNTLAGSEWLTDKIIDAYLYLVVEEANKKECKSAYCITSFFFTMLSRPNYGDITKHWMKVDCFSYKKVLIPIFHKCHWSLAVVDFIEKELRYYDSMKINGIPCLSKIQEHIEKIKPSIDFSTWKMLCPKYARFQANDTRFNFCQDDIPTIRGKMTEEIKTKTLF